MIGYKFVRREEAMSHQHRELTAREKQAIRRLATSVCANYDRGGCLPLDGTCYMFTIGYMNSSLCGYFRNAVLPFDPALEALFHRKPVKPCKRCLRNNIAKPSRSLNPPNAIPKAS